jgi:hypothetical protein
VSSKADTVDDGRIATCFIGAGLLIHDVAPTWPAWLVLPAAALVSWWVCGPLAKPHRRRPG